MPPTGMNRPSADAGLDAFEQVGVAFLEPCEMLGGAHHVGEVRVDIHQRERIGYGAPDLAFGFAHRPQPCGVDMRVTH